MTASLKKVISIALCIALGALILAVLYVLSRTPSNDREWKEYLATPAGASVSSDGTTVSFEHIRDWTYDDQGPVTREYVARTYNVDAVTGMRFLVEPFPSDARFGHTLLIFDFKDAPSVALSVEARIEEGETYAPFPGLFNQFELAYTWGTERDFVTRRSVLLGHDVYVYPLELPREVVREAFVAFAEGTEELEAHPRFYNTLLHNCTNELARIINEKTPNRLPWDWSRIFTGTADRYLFDLGLIPGSSFEEARQGARIKK